MMLRSAAVRLWKAVSSNSNSICSNGLVQSGVCYCTQPRNRNSRTQPSDPAEPQSHRAESDKTTQFGDQVRSFSNRKSFLKAKPEFQNLSISLEEAGEPGPRFRSKTGRRNTQYWYLLQCKQLLKRDRLAEALELFENDMLKGERLQPEEYNYTVLIGGCGRAGYIKKAFKLYNDMKKRGLEPSDATYTALFNACAESPWKQSGLEHALMLRQELRRKNLSLGAITQHALLKTLARVGDLKACFQVLREMLQNGQPITHETFHYLLMCCVEDKEQGFKLSLQVWHQMLSAGIKPDVQNYNILLRAARDCGIGNPALASAVLLDGNIDSSSRHTPHRRGPRARQKENLSQKPLDVDAFEFRLFGDASPQSQVQVESGFSKMSDPEETQSNLTHTQLVPTPSTTDLPVSLSCQSTTLQMSQRPNLLDPSTCHSGVVALGPASSPSDRLALIGDLGGFLDKLSSNGLKPTIKTLTLLADVAEPSSGSIQSLIEVASQAGVKLDVAFYNTLIRRVAKAGDLEGAKAVKVLMLDRKLKPNAQTFCGLALACKKEKHGLQLLSDMETCGVSPNVYVFGALIGQATRRLDFAYLHQLLHQMTRLQVPPNEVIIQQLEFAMQYPPNYNQYKSKNTYLEKIDGFRGFYKQWLEFMPAQETPHPWEKHRLTKVKAEQPDGHNKTSDQSSDLLH